MLEKDKLYKVWIGRNETVCDNFSKLIKGPFLLTPYIIFTSEGELHEWSSCTDDLLGMLDYNNGKAVDIGLQTAIEELSKLSHNQPKETITIAGKIFDKKEFENAIAGLEEV